MQCRVLVSLCNLTTSGSCSISLLARPVRPCGLHLLLLLLLLPPLHPLLGCGIGLANRGAFCGLLLLFCFRPRLNGGTAYSGLIQVIPGILSLTRATGWLSVV